MQRFFVMLFFYTPTMHMNEELLKQIKIIVYEALEEKLEKKLEEKLEEKFNVKLKPIYDRLDSLESLTGELVTQVGKNMVNLEQTRLDLEQFRMETADNFNTVNKKLNKQDQRYCALSQIYPEVNMDVIKLNRRVCALENEVFNPAQ